MLQTLCVETMKPYLHDKTPGADEFKSIINCIGDFDCTSLFGMHIGKSQSVQKEIVSEFQVGLCNKLNQSISNASWQLEYSPNKLKRDAIDIYGKSNDQSVIIEIDKHRADQVAKKFVSRSALFIGSGKLLYISLCYPGTSSMSTAECIKYFGYCRLLSDCMGNEYAGFIIE